MAPKLPSIWHPLEGPGNPLLWRAGFVEGDYLYGIAAQKEPWAASLSADFLC